uniref:T26-3p n=1 Tax=Thermococcus sp. 26/2 TaxID=758583 RepID=D6MY26_9EURY|nr:t26-3p [Thermococcus sp. 26/2]
MDSLEGIVKEIEALDRYASTLRRQIDSAQRELARVTRKRQQLVAELSRLKKARKVVAV